MRVKAIEASNAVAPLGSPEEERLAARADREILMGGQRRARDVVELVEALGLYCQRILMAGVIGDTMTIGKAIDFAVDRYSVPPLLAAVAVGIGIGNRVTLARTDLQSMREILSLEAGSNLARGAEQAQAMRRRGWKGDR